MIKQYSRNQSKKKCNGNSGTSCAHKNATDKEKTQGKKQTTGKNYFERKIIFVEPTNAEKGARTAKQQQRGQLCLSQRRRQQVINFGFNLKKNESIRIF